MSDAEDKDGSFAGNAGTEIGKAFGDAIRGLLVRPSTEAGNYVADWIGMHSDRMRIRRIENLESGLEVVRQKLEDNAVKLRDITPPVEEEMYVLIDGMSLAGDYEVRKLWAGLLATALDPGNSVGIDRPITATISALTPADARVIAYAAFVTDNETSIREDAKRAAGVEEVRHLTVEQARRIDEARLAMTRRLSDYMETSAKMEADFQIPAIEQQSDWYENLRRLGVIRAKPGDYSSTTPRFDGFRGERNDGKFEAVVEHMEMRVQEAEGLALEGQEIEYLYKRDEQDKRIALGFQFTEFGMKFCGVCVL